MTTTPEGRVSAALRQAVIKAGGEVRKVQWQGRVGAPDWLVMLKGVAVFVETKAPGCKPRASQTLEFERIEATDTLPVIVIDNAADCPRLVNAILQDDDDVLYDLLDELSFRRFYEVVK